MNYGAIINTGASQEALNQIKEVYESLDEIGYILRTNTSYKELLESLVNKPEVYLPYDGKDGIYQDGFTKPDPDAYVIGEIVHSNWNGISQVLQDTYAANMHSLGGHDLQDNSDFLITWSSNGTSIIYDRCAPSKYDDTTYALLAAIPNLRAIIKLQQ